MSDELNSEITSKEPTESQKTKTLEAAGWGLLLVWLGITTLLSLGWPIFLIGLGAMVLEKTRLPGTAAADLVELDLGFDLPRSAFHLVCAKSMQHVPRVRVVAEALVDTVGALDAIDWTRTAVARGEDR